MVCVCVCVCVGVCVGVCGCGCVCVGGCVWVGGWMGVVCVDVVCMRAYVHLCETVFCMYMYITETKL